MTLEPGGAAAWVAGVRGRGMGARAGMRLLGSSFSSRGEGEEAAVSRVNYLTGGNSAAWRRGVPTYHRVRYRGVYAGIDLVYYGIAGSLEYDFIVGAGRDPAAIRIGVDGTATLNADGSLAVRAGQAELRWKRPVAYQEVNGARRQVDAAFELRGREVSFRLGEYDRTQPLVVDPVLTFASYWGGSQTDEANAVAVDSHGNIYLAGYTYSSDFPVPGGATRDPGAHYDIFVTKLTPGGGDVVYSTVIGGRGDDTARALAVGADGSVFLTGETNSSDFPVAGAFQSSYAGGTDAYVLKLDPLGNEIVYSTYLGGRGEENGRAIALDRDGNTWVAGFTRSSPFVLRNALQGSNGGQDGFVTKLDPRGALLWSTYLGGRSSDTIHAVAVDGNGDGYVAGETNSDDFPVTSGAFTASKPGRQSGFVSKIDAAGQKLVYSTFLGSDRIGGMNSNAETSVFAVAVDAAGAAYVTGSTTGADFPLAPPTQLQRKKSAGSPNTVSCFVTKLNAAGTALVYSTFLGGSENDQGNAIAVNADGSAVVAGETSSSDFNLKGAFMTERLESGQRAYDGFIARVDASGTSLLWSSLIGGERNDRARGVAVDAAGRLVVAGTTASQYFPRTARALGRTLGKSRDGSSAPWVAVIEEDSRPCQVTVSGTSTSTGQQGGRYGFRVVASEGSCEWKATASADWIHLDGPVSGSGTGTVVFQVDFNSGAARQGFVRVADAVYTVTQSEGGCFYLAAPGRMQVASAGGTVAGSIVVFGDHCPWTVSPLPDWLQLKSPAAGSGDSSLLLTAAANPDAAPRTAVLYVAGELVTVSQPGKGQLSVDAVLDTVGAQPRISPGGFLSIYGENFAAETASWKDATVNGRFPVSLSGLRVRTNGKDSYVSLVAESQINALAPWSALSGMVPVQVITADDSFRTWVRGDAYAPAFFSFFLEGRTYAIATVDGTTTVARPRTLGDTLTRCARGGDTLAFYASGLGPVQGTPPEGSVLPATYPLADPGLLKVTVGGVAAPVTSAALVSTGTYQVTVKVPEGLPAGDLPVSMEIAGVATPAGYYLPVE